MEWFYTFSQQFVNSIFTETDGVLKNRYVGVIIFENSVFSGVAITLALMQADSTK